MSDLFDINNEDHYTSTKLEEINCRQFRWHSCPKEILKFANKMFFLSLEGAKLNTDVFDDATLSDIKEKTRRNAFKQFMIFFLFVAITTFLFSYAIFRFNYYYDNNMMMDWFPYFFALGIGAATAFGSYFYMLFWWYGKLAAMSIDDVVKQIEENSVEVFMTWVKALFIVFMLFICSIFLFPEIFKVIAYLISMFLEQNSYGFGLIFKVLKLGGEEGVLLLVENLRDFAKSDSNATYYILTIFLITNFLYVFLAKKGYTTGLKIKTGEIEVMRERVEDGKGYNFEIAMKKLQRKEAKEKELREQEAFEREWKKKTFMQKLFSRKIKKGEKA